MALDEARTDERRRVGMLEVMINNGVSLVVGISWVGLTLTI